MVVKKETIEDRLRELQHYYEKLRRCNVILSENYLERTLVYENEYNGKSRVDRLPDVYAERCRKNIEFGLGVVINIVELLCKISEDVGLGNPVDNFINCDQKTGSCTSTLVECIERYLRSKGRRFKIKLSNSGELLLAGLAYALTKLAADLIMGRGRISKIFEKIVVFYGESYPYLVDLKEELRKFRENLNTLVTKYGLEVKDPTAADIIDKMHASSILRSSGILIYL